MNIAGTTNRTLAAEIWQAKQQQIEEKKKEQENKKDGSLIEGTSSNTPLKPDMDQYIPGEKIGSPDPERKGDSEDEKIKVNDSDKQNEEPEIMIADNDKAVREIEKLKEMKAELEQQLNMSQDDPEKLEKVQLRLQQVDRELKMKDNSNYLRQNTTFTPM